MSNVKKPIDFEAITAACEHLDSIGMKAAAEAIRALDESRENAFEQLHEFAVSANHLAFHRAELRAYAQWLERRIGGDADGLRREAQVHERLQQYLAASDPKRAEAVAKPATRGKSVMAAFGETPVIDYTADGAE